jgi:hypothetical protein
LFGYSLVLQVAEISGFFVQSGLLFVAGLLSVPGFRHVGAQGFYYGSLVYMKAQGL